MSFLSRTMGRVRGVAAGARRPKSRFGSTLERLSYVRIWFFERETRDLARINQCEMIESFLDAFHDYASSVALSLFSEVTEALLPEHEASDASFRLLLLVSQTVKRTGKVELALAYFSLWAVRLGGWLPSLDRCMVCGRPLPDAEPAFFSASNLLVGCGKCHRPGMRAMPPGALALGRKMLTERLDSLGGGLVAPGVERKITDVMLDVIENQIDRKLASRELLEPPER